MGDATAIFSIHDKKDDEIHAIVQEVYDALKEKGYNPVNQLVGYILSEDPTYITTYKNARAIIRRTRNSAGAVTATVRSHSSPTPLSIRLMASMAVRFPSRARR